MKPQGIWKKESNPFTCSRLWLPMAAYGLKIRETISAWWQYFQRLFWLFMHQTPLRSLSKAPQGGGSRHNIFLFVNDGLVHKEGNHIFFPTRHAVQSSEPDVGAQCGRASGVGNRHQSYGDLQILQTGPCDQAPIVPMAAYGCLWTKKIRETIGACLRF